MPSSFSFTFFGNNLAFPLPFPALIMKLYWNFMFGYLKFIYFPARPKGGAVKQTARQTVRRGRGIHKFQVYRHTIRKGG